MSPVYGFIVLNIVIFTSSCCLPFYWYKLDFFWLFQVEDVSIATYVSLLVVYLFICLATYFFCCCCLLFAEFSLSSLSPLLCVSLYMVSLKNGYVLPKIGILKGSMVWESQSPLINIKINNFTRERSGVTYQGTLETNYQDTCRIWKTKLAF